MTGPKGTAVFGLRAIHGSRRSTRSARPRTAGRSVRCPQRGLLLPLLALALATGLVGSASWWLVGLPGGSPLDGDGSRARLSAARRALVAHATAYPDLYGPGGAGPGHLVCPDTDTPLDVAATRRPGRSLAGTGNDAFRTDGPDPPCGGGALAIGRLPRHVSLPGGRRAFHVEDGQRFVYAVSTGYVNNPIGRVVNLSTGVDAIDGDVVAVIIDPGGVALSHAALARADGPRALLARVREIVRRDAGLRAARSLPHVFVHRDRLLDAAAMRVAHWFVEAATRAAVSRCEPAGDATGCRQRWPDPRCPDALDPHRWLVGVRPSACDVENDDASGPMSPPSARVLENTPFDRHWFPRNEWSRAIALSRHDDCLRVPDDACRLHVIDRVGDAVSIQLAPGGGENDERPSASTDRRS